MDRSPLLSVVTVTVPHVQLDLDGMPRRLYPCTPSRLMTWLDCPRRYRLTYLDRPAPPKGPAWAHNSVGAAVHTALAAWWRLPVTRRTVEAAGRLVASGWLSDGFRDAEQSAQWRDHARVMVERYVTELDPSDEPLGIERTVATRTEQVALSGRVDRLDDRAGDLVVVDYKTGRHILDTDDARGSLALAVYAVAASRTLRRTCRRVELHHLPSGTVVAWEHTDESLNRQLRRAESLAAECASADDAYRSGLSDDEHFPPRPGPRCGWCDLVRHCPEGRAVAPVRFPWDGLAVLEGVATS